jgi:hypothetical protein
VQFEHLKRRDFITLLGDSAALPPVACAQHLPGKLPTIGLLGPATPATRGPQRPISKKGRLQDFGWITTGDNPASWQGLMIFVVRTLRISVRANSVDSIE